MPFAEYQGNNGLALPTLQLQGAETYANLFARAESVRQSRARLEMDKQTTAAQLALSDIRFKQENVQLRMLQNAEQLQSRGLDVQLAELDAARVKADADAEARKRNAALMASLPTDIDALIQIPIGDHNAFTQKWAELSAKYGHLAQDPVYGQQFAAAFAPAASAAEARTATFSSLVLNAGAQLTAKVASATTLAELSQIASDPMFPYVRKADPEFAKIFDARRKEIHDAGVEREKNGATRANKVNDSISNLRKELTGRPEIRAFRDVDAAMQKVENAASGEPNAAKDLALIFNFMKILDPGSVVREGEFATAQNAAGVPARIQNLYNRLLTGERLNPTQRQEFIVAAESAYDAQVQTTIPSFQLFHNRAVDLGINPEDILTSRDLEIMRTGKRPRSAQPAKSPTQELLDLVRQERARAGRGPVDTRR